MANALSAHYARALADAVFAPASGITPQAAVEQIQNASQMLKSSPELRRVLHSPAIPREKKAALMGTLANAQGMHRLVHNFLMVVVKHRHTADLPGILESFEAVVDRRLGFARAEISSAAELNAQQRSELEAALAAATGQNIRAVYHVDPALLGGVLARVGSKEFDGSLHGRLQTMRRRLAVAS